MSITLKYKCKLYNYKRVQIIFVIEFNFNNRKLCLCYVVVVILHCILSLKLSKKVPSIRVPGSRYVFSVIPQCSRVTVLSPASQQLPSTTTSVDRTYLRRRKQDPSQRNPASLSGKSHMARLGWWPGGPNPLTGTGAASAVTGQQPGPGPASGVDIVR